MDYNEIEQALKDYHWMLNEIARQRSMIKINGGNLTAQYGIEATMPTPQGGNSDPVYREVERREKKSKWVQRLEYKVMFVQDRTAIITDEREVAVLECLLDGLSITAISKHMGLSRRHVQRIKESVVCKMSQMSHMSQKLPAEKCTV